MKSSSRLLSDNLIALTLIMINLNTACSGYLGISDSLAEDPERVVFQMDNANAVNLSIVTSKGKSWSIDWGDGTIDKNIDSGANNYIKHIYTNNYTGPVVLFLSAKDTIKEFRSEFGSWNISIEDLPRSLNALVLTSDYLKPSTINGVYSHYTNLDLDLVGSISGSLSALPNELERFVFTSKAGSVSGHLSELSPNLVEFVANAAGGKELNFSITGKLSDLPRSLKTFVCTGTTSSGSCAIEGSVADLPSVLSYFWVSGVNTIEGDVRFLPSTLTFFRLLGRNSTNGDIATLPVGLSYYYNAGSNTTSGSIENLPVGLTYYSNTGNNTTSGSIGALPAGLLSYINRGSNTTSGSVAALPVTLTYFTNEGSNTTHGDIGALPAGLTYYANNGNNTTSGSIETLPVGLTHFNNTGSNTTSGSIENLPVGLTYYSNTGNNTTSGNIGALPAGLLFYINRGSNTTSGEISDLPQQLIYFDNRGFNTVRASTNQWSAAKTGFRLFNLMGIGLPQNEIDNILSALTQITSWSNQKSVDLRGNNAAPSVAGLASRTVIISNGASTVSVKN